MGGHGFPLPHRCTQFGGDALRGDAGVFDLIAAEADGSHAGVASAAEALADLGEVDELGGGQGCPGIGADRDLGARTGARDGDGVGGLRIEEVRDELAEGLGFKVEQVEEDDFVLEHGALANEVDGGPVLFKQGLNALLDEGQGDDVGEGEDGEVRDDARDEVGGVGVLDDEGELECGLVHLDGHAGGSKAGAIDDVGPVKQIIEAGEVEAVGARGGPGDEACARYIVGVEELARRVGGVLGGLEVGAVGRGEEGALVMVEPPGQAGGRRIFEVDDGVFAGAEDGVGDGAGGGVGEAAVLVGSRGAEDIGVEFGKDGGGTGSVEALIVVEDSEGHGFLVRREMSVG